MDDQYNRIGFFSGSTLKIVACILMAIDHIGLEIFPDIPVFRIIGRLAFPIFAFFIAEGCKYTKNRIKRFLMLFLIGAGFMFFYYLYNGQIYGNIFMTFAFSVLFIYLLDYCKKLLFCSSSVFVAICSILLFISALLCGYLIFDIIHFEYGFTGMLVPVFVSLFNFKDIPVNKGFKSLDCHMGRMICLAVGLIPLSIFGRMDDIQFYCLFSIIPLLFYNGKQGPKKLKYFFYIFYPAHLIVIEGIAILLKLI